MKNLKWIMPLVTIVTSLVAALQYFDQIKNKTLLIHTTIPTSIYGENNNEIKIIYDGIIYKQIYHSFITIINSGQKSIALNEFDGSIKVKYRNSKILKAHSSNEIISKKIVIENDTVIINPLNINTNSSYSIYVILDSTSKKPETIANIFDTKVTKEHVDRGFFDHIYEDTFPNRNARIILNILCIICIFCLYFLYYLRVHSVSNLLLNITDSYFYKLPIFYLLTFFIFVVLINLILKTSYIFYNDLAADVDLVDTTSLAVRAADAAGD
jgi:hypothetical protein